MNRSSSLLGQPKHRVISKAELCNTTSSPALQNLLFRPRANSFTLLSLERPASLGFAQAPMQGSCLY